MDLLIRLSKNFNSLKGFIETYTLDPIYTKDYDNSDSDVVTLITIHSAKGTEAKICYLLRSQVGIFPHSKSLGKEGQMWLVELVQNLALAMTSRIWQAKEYLAKASFEVSFGVASNWSK